MIKNKIGAVTENEKLEIKGLYERKLALSELLLTINNPSLGEQEKDSLYARIVNDMTNVKSQFDRWWAEKSSKYQWAPMKNGSWSIDFSTNEIFVVADA